MNISRAPELAMVKSLLKANALPTADVDKLDSANFLYCGHADKPVGVIGLEIVGDHALLRSLVVADSVRGQGCGQALVKALEKLARDKHIEGLYLLTETAELFFDSLGYAVVDRASAPDAIQQTPEFSDLCPATAVLMFKAIERD